MTVGRPVTATDQDEGADQRALAKPHHHRRKQGRGGKKAKNAGRGEENLQHEPSRSRAPTVIRPKSKGPLCEVDELNRVGYAGKSGVQTYPTFG